jgi:flagellar hook assembly protein FlgD
LRAAPNPSGGAQALQFSLTAGGFARVAIHDVSGRVVRVLHEGALPAGPQRLEWDGLSTTGVRVAPGIYFARLDAGEAHAAAKLLRVNR